GLRTQWLAGSEKVRLYVRSLRRGNESLHGSAESAELHPLYAGLRRPRRFSNGVGTSRAGPGSDCSRRCVSQRRLGCKLENAPRILGGSSRKREHVAHKSTVSGDHPYTACGK